jgi:hypothetical protein
LVAGNYRFSNSNGRLVKDRFSKRGPAAHDRRMRLTPLRVHLVLALGFATLVTTAAAIAAQDKDMPAVPYPKGFRAWQHVSSQLVGSAHKSFANRGGLHHFYANDLAVEGYRTGTFPNGAVIVDEGVFTRDGEGLAAGITLEGDRRGVDVMVKNDRLYKDTGGWGFDHFDRDTTTSTMVAKARTTCFECHSKATRDHVFSTIRK